MPLLSASSPARCLTGSRTGLGGSFRTRAVEVYRDAPSSAEPAAVFIEPVNVPHDIGGKPGWGNWS